MIVRIAGIAADITSEMIVIVVTFMKTFSIRNNLSNVDMNGPSLSDLLLKGGVCISDRCYVWTYLTLSVEGVVHFMCV